MNRGDLYRVPAARVELDIRPHVRHTCITMKTATIRDLRNRFARIGRWIEEGEQVRITKRGRAFARLLPDSALKRRKVKMPDFEHRVQRLFGSTKLTPQQSAALREDLRGGR